MVPISTTVVLGTAIRRPSYRRAKKGSLADVCTSCCHYALDIMQLLLPSDKSCQPHPVYHGCG
jgi:hypothetical protein